MMGKILFVAGAATGYVLGSRAGREAYDKLKVRADKFWNSDKVQSGIRETKSRVAEKTPELRKKAEDVLHRGSGSAGGSGTSDSGTSGSGTNLETGASGTAGSENVGTGKPGD